MQSCDVLIVGASFSGLTVAHHLPKNLNVVIIDKKTALDAAIESTGLVTQVTKDLLGGFVDVENYIPNKINTIGVMGPVFDSYFFSHTREPWIYSTDIPQLIKRLSLTLRSGVELQLGAALLSYQIKSGEEYPVVATIFRNGSKEEIRAKFIVGADGSKSTVAKLNPNLSVNKKFLFGYEKVFYGDITFGDHPDHTVYHFWFGAFSIGYGGWLSPTIINGKKAFRLGLAKLEKDIDELHKLDEFIEILKQKNIIKIDPNDSRCVLSFGHSIPVGGVLKHVVDEHSILVGDAAGFCGAFAADGIKGSVVSGKAAAQVVGEYLAGNKNALKNYLRTINSYGGLITYYKKQVLYRWLWNRMQSNRSFSILHRLIEREKDSFLYQFCDSKDKHKSLLRVVLHWKNIHYLVWYGCSVVMDIINKILRR